MNPGAGGLDKASAEKFVKKTMDMVEKRLKVPITPFKDYLLPEKSAYLQKHLKHLQMLAAKRTPNESNEWPTKHMALFHRRGLSLSAVTEHLPGKDKSSAWFRAASTRVQQVIAYAKAVSVDPSLFAVDSSQSIERAAVMMGANTHVGLTCP